MRTDPDGERAGDGGAGDGPPISRRGFVLATGALAAPSLSGVAVGAAETPGRPVEVEATLPYIRSVRDSARTFERADGGGEVRVRAAERETLERVREGSTDVHVSGRPPETPDTGSESGGEGALVGARLVDARSVLDHPNGTWRECLRSWELRERWTSDEPVETWVEADGRGEPAVEGPVTASTAGQAPDAGDQSDDERTTLVRGTRPYQYADGYGGVGYYEVGRDAIGPGRPGDAPETTVPIVRLGYLHGTAEALQREDVRAFLRFHERRSTATSDGAPALARAADGGARPPS